MAVRIGSIELSGLQDIRTVDARNLVQQRGPGQSGSVAQDLGREPLTVVMEGLLLGDDPNAALEELRGAQTDARPLAFAADAIAGAELTDVLIQDLKVRQLAGFRLQYWFHLEVREYTEPPEAPGSAAAAVDDAVAADAAAWTDSATGAAGVLADPSTLADAALANPDILTQLSSGDIVGALQGGASSLTGGQFAGVLGALGKVDVAKFASVVQDLASSGSFSEFMEKLAGEGIDLLEELTGVDLGPVASLVKAIAGGSDFLAKLQDVAARAADIGKALQGFDLGLGEAALMRPAGTTPRDVVARIDELVLAVNALLETDTVAELGNLARDLGIGGLLGTAFGGLVRACEQIRAWLAQLEQPLAKVAQVTGVVQGLASALQTLGESAAKSASAKDTAAEVLDIVTKVLGGAGKILGGLPRYDEEVVPIRDAIGELVLTCKDLQTKVGGGP